MWKQLLSQPLTFLPCILLSIQLPHNKLLMVLSSLIRFCFDGGESKHSYRPSNLNTLYVWHFYASPLSKNCKNFIWSGKFKKHIWAGVSSCFFFCLFEALECLFLKFVALYVPLCSIYYHNLVSFLLV